MILKNTHWIVFIGVSFLGCGNLDDAQHLAAQIEQSTAAIPPEADIVGRVDGRPIFGSEVEALVSEANGKISPREALDMLVRNALLAAEARRRGFDRYGTVKSVQKDETVRALLKLKVQDAVTLENLDPARLVRYFDDHKSLYAHGPMRRTVHFLAKTDKGLLSEEEAGRAAEQARAAAISAKNETEFQDKLKPIVAASKKTMLVERLPAFEEKGSRFAEPFVQATFKIPKVGDLSPPVETKFGFHVIYLAEDIPALNRPFEEVKSEIAKILLPVVRQERAQALLNRLLAKNTVFVYDDALGQRSAPK